MDTDPAHLTSSADPMDIMPLSTTPARREIR
jgi:hypothetical protein